MEKPFTRMFKSFFHFQRQDRNGILLLVAAIVAVLLGHVIVDHLEIESSGDFSAFEKALIKWEDDSVHLPEYRRWFAFDPNRISEEELESLDVSSFIKNNLLKYRASGGRFSDPADVRKIYGMNDSIFALMESFLHISREEESGDPGKSEFSILSSGSFDPNTVCLEELLCFGFSRFQATNLIRYRQRGGYFSRPGDLMKIYGVDSAFFESVKTRIRMEKGQERNSLKEKAVPGAVVELNGADSIELTGLKGIGPVFASRILKYRRLLGGFYSARQLLEVYGFPRETYLSLQGKIVVDTTKLKKIRINFAAYSEMIRHPYMEKEVAEAVLDYRERHGPFTSKDQLLKAGLVDSSAFVILGPYLSCR
jgi:DNA uptake protein ComE-like DNA-binding protein